MFDTELKYFIDNQDTLVRKYAGKVLVLRGAKVAKVYDDMLTAYVESKGRYGLGGFMLQPCTPGPEAFTMSISAANTIYE